MTPIIDEILDQTVLELGKLSRHEDFTASFHEDGRLRWVRCVHGTSGVKKIEARMTALAKFLVARTDILEAMAPLTPRGIFLPVRANFLSVRSGICANLLGGRVRGTLAFDGMQRVFGKLAALMPMDSSLPVSGSLSMHERLHLIEHAPELPAFVQELMAQGFHDDRLRLLRVSNGVLLENRLKVFAWLSMPDTKAS